MRTIHQLDVDHQVAVRRAVQTIRRKMALPHAVVPEVEQAVVLSNDGGTCTLCYDGVTPVPGAHYLRGYIPAGGDLVYVVRLGKSDIWVLGRLAAGTAAPAQQDAAGTVTTASLTYVGLSGGPAVTVWLDPGQYCWVTVTARLSNNAGTSHAAVMSFAVSGAETVAADDANSIENDDSVSATCSKPTLFVASAAAGNRTFTAQYKVVASTLGSFVDRRITADPR